MFVLTQLLNGKQIILISSDTTLTGEQVIEAYGWRFKIEAFERFVNLNAIALGLLQVLALELPNVVWTY